MKITHHSIQGARSHQEDRFAIVEEDDRIAAAVFDGHGGDAVSEDLALNFGDILWQNARNLPAVFKVMAGMSNDYKAGSTCSVVSATETGVFMAVLGDSPIIYKGKNGVVILPVHNARTNEKERDAAVGRGALWDDGGYLWGKDGSGLQMSRAFGDAKLRTFLSDEPEMFEVLDWEWILIGTDGIFPGQDVSLDNAGVRNAIKLMDAGCSAEDIVNASPKNDNVTAITIRK